MRTLGTVCTALLVIGGINWGLVGLFDFNLVAAVLGTGVAAKVIYTVVGVAALLKVFEMVTGERREMLVTGTTDYPRKVA